jgi:hypothetical protein
MTIPIRVKVGIVGIGEGIGDEIGIGMMMQIMWRGLEGVGHGGDRSRGGDWQIGVLIRYQVVSLRKLEILYLTCCCVLL